jgi:hypothetical protein
MKLSRRIFMVGAASLPLAYFCARWLTEDHSVDLVISILRRHLSYLKVSNADLVAFAQDMVRSGELVQIGSSKFYLLGLVHPFYATLIFGFERPTVRDQLALFESRLITRFLFSTDFFWKGSNITQVVTYQKLHNPYQMPCANPFRQIDSASSD